MSTTSGASLRVLLAAGVLTDGVGTTFLDVTLGRGTARGSLRAEAALLGCLTAVAGRHFVALAAWRAPALLAGDLQTEQRWRTGGRPVVGQPVGEAGQHP